MGLLCLLLALFGVYCTQYNSAFPFQNGNQPGKEEASEILRNSQMLRSIINRASDDELNRLYGEQFQSFVETYNKQYVTEGEKARRFRLFSENMFQVEMLRKVEMGTATYGVTKFSDLSREEFLKQNTGLLPKSKRLYIDTNMEQAEIPNSNIPKEYDWRDKDAVTKVKNQGSCGSCYAFSVTGNIEGQYAIKSEDLISLSEQEIVDCDTYDLGCDGGLLQWTYLAIEELGGLETEDDYEYVSYKQDECQIDESDIKVKIKGSVNISSYEPDLAQWLYSNGPVATTLNAAYLQHYLGGVMYLPQYICDPDNLNHAVLLVGYGVKSTEIPIIHVPYWIVKNSWAESWGEEGYFRIFRGAGTCGINVEPSSAIIADE